jgi:hypothetical protein
MFLSRAIRAALATFPLILWSTSALGHLSYSGRNFGTFTGLELQTVTITGQTVPNNWGWADGTDADFAHSHELKFFRFTLEITSSVTISVTSINPSEMLPGFSLYSGLAHTSPLDYETDLTFQYLATLPGPTKEGAFNAMATWRMGNDASLSYADFSTFSYVGHAADGTAANFGDAPGVNGDGSADGSVSSTFLLGPGSYTLAVGGANYGGQGIDATADGVAVAVTVVPEPAAGMVATCGFLLLASIRRRKKTALPRI